MRYLSLILLCFLVVSCAEKEKSHQFTSVTFETIFKDSVSIRAIEIMDGSLAFAADQGTYGLVDLKTNAVKTNIQGYDSILPEYRAVAHTATDFFMLSVANPALLYKTGDNGKMQLVYKEEDENVFYDAMKFWNNQEGLAIGDSMNGCLSVIITRDGGNTWKKLPCSDLPKADEGEGAFAASNTNIAIIGDNTWIATTSSRIYYSGNKGKTWKLFNTPVIKDEPTQGIYSIDFYNENLGIAIGGDYTQPAGNIANKAITKDGGKTWQLISDGKDPIFKSCVQFVPRSNGEDIVAIGFTGISYSSDMGNTWKKLSDEPFYTLRFLNDTIAYAAGRSRIAKLTFK